jgi:dCTP deaminase
MSSDALLLFPEFEGQLDDLYTTGLLPSQKIEELTEAGHIRAGVPICPDQIQPSSIDLRLSSIAYRIRGSFLPTPNATVQSKLQHVKLEEIDISDSALLQQGSVYLVPLEEELSLPESISGKANPKSTTGRLDIFTRLITDYGNEFEYVRPGYKGKLYAEIVPLTFSVIVRRGTRLNQLRLRKGIAPPSDAMLRRLHQRDPIIFSQDAIPVDPMISEGLRLSVDLMGFEGSDIVGYQAKKNAPPIDLARIGYYDSAQFWEPLLRDDQKSVVLQPGEFYILRSREKVSIPPGYAAEMVPYDPSVGEFRIHYAGFFDPGFGWGSDDQRGTHAVLEVRSHDVPSVLEHGQVVCRLIYERLMARPARLYGREIGSTYQSQRLSLSKQFKSQ